MPFKLRPYQDRMITDARAALRKHRAVLIQSPTGSGKTAIGAYMASRVEKRGLRSWFTVHRDFLLEQTSQTYRRAGIAHSFIAAGRPGNPHALSQIAGIGTLRRRLDRYQPPDVCFIDEAHHLPAATWRKVFEWMPKTHIIGFSATPLRLDGAGLEDFFGNIVLGPEVGWLIENGYLSDYKAFAPSTPNMKGIHTRAGDYARDEIDDLMDTSEIIGNLVQHYRKHADGLRAVYFCVSIRHSEHVAASFTASGIPARHLDGSASTVERIQAARDFAAGKIKVLTNVDLFGEGYDLASQSGTEVAIECVGLARPTKSLMLHLQQIGRSLRIAPGKNHAVILDHAGNLMRHGLPDDERQWTLQGMKASSRKACGPPVRQCAECFGVCAAHCTACPYCGAAFVVEGRSVDELDKELEEINIIEARKARLREQGSAQSLDALVQLARARRYANPEKWASIIHAARQAKAASRADSQAAAYLRE